MFTLAISCLTTSDLPCFTDLTFQVPIHIALYSIRLYFHHLAYPQLDVVFVLAPSLHSFWSYAINSSLLNIAISGRARISSEYQNLDILTPLSKHAYTDAKWLPVFSKFLYDLIVFILYHFFFLNHQALNHLIQI